MTEPTGSLRAALDENDHAGILLRAAEQAEVAACIHRTALHDGLTDDTSVAEWAEKQARTFRKVAAALAQPAPPTEATEARETDAGEQGLPCQTCQGNGEIVTDWHRYVHGQPGDCGDEGTADCPDCNGTGRMDEPAPTETTPPHDGLREPLLAALEFIRDAPRVIVADRGDWLTKNLDALIAALSPSEVQPAGLGYAEAFEWLAAHTAMELHHYSPMRCDDDDEAVEWRVTHVSGSINDREWTTVGRGETPLAAIQSAIRTLANGEQA